VGKPEGKRTIERPRHSREDNIKMGFQEVECEEWGGASWYRIGTGLGDL
jgi:hypothetical protein